MGIERQLQNIKNKAELHDWIDRLPEDAEGVLLIEKPEGGIVWYEYGPIDLKTVNWLLTTAQTHLVKCALSGDWSE